MHLALSHRKLMLWLLLGMLLSVYLIWANTPQVRRVSGGWITDFDDPRQLVGFADAVFVGRVVEQVGRRSDRDIPQGQFKVEVLESIKSKRKVNPRSIESDQEPRQLANVVTVDQYGGEIRDATGKRTVVLMDDQPLLVPGQVYLLATAYDSDKDWYHVLPLGAVVISNDGERTKVVEKFIKAKNEEKPFKLPKGEDTPDPPQTTP